MAERGDTFYNPVTKTRVVFVTVPADTGGRELLLDWHVPPGEGLPAARHYHAGPDGVIVERFELFSGTATCQIGAEKRTVSAPGVIEIPFNVVHVHPRNVGQDTLHVRQNPWNLSEPNPALLARLERYFETLTALSQQGKANRKGDITDPLQSALTLEEYIFDPTFLPTIPRPAQKALFGSLAALARRLGYQAYHRPEREQKPAQADEHRGTPKVDTSNKTSSPAR
jgi:quercetin dioxygenase-like cupin family protein